MRCSACGSPNPEAARFCGSCGSALTVACEQCDAALAPGQRFCTGCGHAVESGDGADAGPDTAAPPERRRVSVLFVDLENFTSLAERLDPEEVRSVQSRYFEAARSVVASHGGTIEKFIGDAVMAVWGAPVAHEDDAERAVRAALAIVDAVGRLGGAASGAGLTARAAVTTGEAAVSVGMAGQGMVAGDLVNVAARLQSHAPSGGVLVDGPTREGAPEAATYRAAGRISLKGRTSRLAAYRVTGAASARPGQRTGLHAGSFVGRDGELRELVDLFDGVVRDRRSRLVSISGIAGVGKSRLAWELGEHVEALPQEVAWHVGRAPAYGEGITFAAVSEMVRRRIGVAENVDPSLARRQLAAVLEELVRDEVERRWIEPRVAVLLGNDDDPAYDRDELFAAWRRFFERVSDRSPAILVFEDLHWADPGLLDFIEHLASWTRDHPILIVAISRPELLDHRPTWGVGLGRFTSIHLERLPDAAMRELLASRSGHLAERSVRAILEHAGGVPLYAVEVVRILADRHPSPGERRASPRVAAEPIDVPDSLHGLIAARIDALPPAERRLLLSAAVLGRRFGMEALAAVAGEDVAGVRELADSLVRRELLAVDEERASPAHGQLGFVQDLVREVAYRTLARTERRTLHLAAARYLESSVDDGLADSLAGHLVEAHRLAPTHPDARRIARRAVAALRRAAREALRLHAPQRALADLERALRLVDVAEQRAVLLEEAAAAARAAARLEVAERHLRELVAQRSDGGRPAEATRARAQLASVLLMAQRNEPALAELEAAVTAMGEAPNDPVGVEVAAQLARARMLVGDDQAGFDWAQRAIDAATRLGLDAVATDVLVTRGTARFRLGDEADGLADLQRSIEEARSGGFTAVELRARNNLAWLVVTDDPRTTLETARQGLALATAMGIGDIAAQLAEVACSAAIDTGDWDWALGIIAEMTAEPIPNANRINLLSVAGIIAALTARPEARRAFEAGQPLPDGTDPQVVSGVLHARAWLAFIGGDLPEAADLAGQAAAETFGAERAHQLTLQARAALWRGDAVTAESAIAAIESLHLDGRAAAASAGTLAAGVRALAGQEDAAELFRRADEAWSVLDLPVHRAICLLDAWRLLGDRNAGDEAKRLLRALGAKGLRRLLAERPQPVSSSAGAPPPARSRPPRAGTARRTDGARRRPPATDPPPPPR